MVSTGTNYRGPLKPNKGAYPGVVEAEMHDQVVARQQSPFGPCIVPHQGCAPPAASTWFRTLCASAASTTSRG